MSDRVHMMNAIPAKIFSVAGYRVNQGKSAFRQARGHEKHTSISGREVFCERHGL